MVQMLADVEHNYYRHEAKGDQLSVLARAANQSDLALAVACTPAEDVDFDGHVEVCATRIGRSRGITERYVSVGHLLSRMPRLAEQVSSRGHLPLLHLDTIAKATDVLSQGILAAVEEDLLAYFSPRRNNQAIPGYRALSRHLRQVIRELEPELEPPDPRDRDDGGERVDIDADGDRTFAPIGFGTLFATLRTDHLAEITDALEAIRAHCRSQGETCTLADALLHLVRKSIPAQVVINVYRDINGGPAWMPGAGWLSSVATDEWMQRATDILLSADSAAAGYTPTPAQRARVQGRDGTCRFPGCDVDAHRCDIDHVIDFNHEDPAAGGPTDPANLHCLCRRHHNLKTAGLWKVDLDEDGSETWTGGGGGRTITFPQGPLAGQRRFTIDDRLSRKAATRRRANIRKAQREAREAEEREAEEHRQQEEDDGPIPF